MRRNHRHHTRFKHIVESAEIGINDLIPFTVLHPWKNIVAIDSGIEHNPIIRPVLFDVGFNGESARLPVGNIELQIRS